MSDARKYFCFCEANCKFETMTKEQILAAIAQAAETGLVIDPDAGFISKVKETNAGGYLTFWVGTQAQHNAIAEKDPSCFYIITDDTKDADIAKALADAADHASQRNNPHGVTYEQAGAAPAGYGLGEESKDCADCNLVTGNGFYRFSGANCVNYPDRVTNFKYGAMVQFTRKTNDTSKTAYQIASYGGNCAMRHGDVTAGTWNDWEYLNPPLMLNAEYKTIERYNGKAVYTKRIDFGAAPNTTTKTVSLEVSSANIISCDVYLYKDNVLCQLPSYDADVLRAYHWCSKNSLSIRTAKDLSSYNFYAIFKYTKD